MKLPDNDSVTKVYYECWMGEQGCLCADDDLSFIYSEERNTKQIGYSKCLDLYVWIQNDKKIISYGDSAKPKINDVSKIMSSMQNIPDIIAGLSNLYERTVEHQIKYKFDAINNINSNNAVTLAANNYQDYENFFRACHTNLKNLD